jgi:hypothetical protein
MILPKGFVLFIFALISLGCLGLLSCGIEAHFYLPQVPEPQRSFNTGATLFIPPDFLDGYYYATGYRIFYRIYRSSVPAGDYENIGHIQNNTLTSDFNFFASFTDPQTNSIISSRTFSNRGFFELDFETALGIGTDGGTLSFIFHDTGIIPTVSINNGPSVILRRSANLINIPDLDFYLRNTEGLNDSALNNADVASGQHNAGFAYVLMYIVAIGNNPENFDIIVSSKPTLINLFRLPNM